MKRYLMSRGIELQVTAPYTPQQNGKAERENRTVVESARTMLKARNLPLYLWAEAVNTATYVLNRTPSSQHSNDTPYELWMGQKPKLSHIKTFDADAYVHVPGQLRKKLDSKATKLIMVEYQGESSNYRLFNPKTRQITESRDVIFNEQTTNLINSEENFA